MLLLLLLQGLRRVSRILHGCVGVVHLLLLVLLHEVLLELLLLVVDHLLLVLQGRRLRHELGLHVHLLLVRRLRHVYVLVHLLLRLLHLVHLLGVLLGHHGLRGEVAAHGRRRPGVCVHAWVHLSVSCGGTGSLDEGSMGSCLVVHHGLLGSMHLVVHHHRMSVSGRVALGRH